MKLLQFLAHYEGRVRALELQHKHYRGLVNEEVMHK